MTPRLSNRSILATAAMMMAAATGGNFLSDVRRDPSLGQCRHRKPTFRDMKEHRFCQFTDSRQLREFSVKGHKVMAYSRKDAITRLKHRKMI